MAIRKASKTPVRTKAPGKKTPKRTLEAAAQKISKAVKKAKRKITRQPKPVVPAIEPPSPRSASGSKVQRRMGSPPTATSRSRRKLSPRVIGGVNLRTR